MPATRVAVTLDRMNRRFCNTEKGMQPERPIKPSSRRHI